MARATPRISSGKLLLAESEHPPITLGSEAWRRWLLEDLTESFRYESAQGSFTARREQKPGGWYWVAYRKRGGRLYKAYLGKSEELTQERLNAAARALAGQDENPPASLDSAQQRPPPPLAYRQRIPLLTTKLSIPPTRPSLVARARLLERVNEGSRRPLLLLSAPAGFGKTSLLSQWVRQSALPVAWVALDEQDDDPVRFWSYVIAALQQFSPNLGEQALALLDAPQPAPLESIITVLINDASAFAGSFTLVLDDYHVISAEPIHRSLAFLLDHQPSQMRLLIASRAEPPLPLARLRAHDQLFELHAADLRFSPEEAAIFLNDAMRLQLSPEEISALEDRTEGWIAGLHLAALSLQGQARPSDVIASVAGSHRYIIDYLVGEVLDRQPEPVQTFLLRTSVLDQLSGPLCEAVTSQPDAQAMLEWLEQANLFLVPLDNERRWYRYHQLFGSVLLDRLNRRHPDERPELHRRAAAWYEAQGMLSEAIHQALAAQDMHLAARLVEQAAEALFKRGEGATLYRWMQALPDALVRQRPQLSFFYAGLLIILGQSEAAEARLRDIERTLGANALQSLPNESQKLLGELLAARAAAAAFEGDVEQTIAFTRQALEHLPEDDLFGRSVLAAALGAAYWWSGNLDAAEQAFIEARAVGQVAGNLYSTISSICGQGFVQIARGKLHQAQVTFQQALALAAAPGTPPVPAASLAYGGLGEVARQRNDLEAAATHLKTSIELGKDWGDARSLGYCYGLLAHVQQARGHSQEALELLQHAEQLARQHQISQLLVAVPASQAWLALKQGNLALSTGWAERFAQAHTGAPRYTYERSFAYVVLARVYLAQRRAAEARYILEGLRQNVESEGKIAYLIETLMLLALAAQQEGQPEQALALVTRALALGEPEGALRIFLDEGKPMAALLQQVAEAQRKGQPLIASLSPAYLQKLLAACGQATPAEEELSSSLLSEREHEILRLLAAGKTNQEIAGDLVLAVSTVKWYVKHLYEKLDAHNRAQAISNARALRLLS